VNENSTIAAALAARIQVLAGGGGEWQLKLKGPDLPKSVVTGPSLENVIDQAVAIVDDWLAEGEPHQNEALREAEAARPLEVRLREFDVLQPELIVGSVKVNRALRSAAGQEWRLVVAQLPDVVFWGDTLEDAVAQAEDALALAAGRNSNAADTPLNN